jgi:hypothetical protein
MKISRRVPVSRILSIFLVLCAFFLLGTYRLDTFPPVWWDEGWTLAVARNWVEFGHYGQMLMGEPRGPGLSAAFPVVAPVALSFKLFGVGVWQGRLPGLFFTLGAIMMMVYLAEVLYNRKVAVGTLFVIIFMQGHEHLNPLLVGRQVLGEMPMMFYLLAGYVFFLFALKRSYWFLIPAVFFWGIAIKTKAQVLPFWVISLLAPLGVALLKKWWKESLLFILALGGTWMVGEWVLRFQGMLIGAPIVAEAPLEGLYEVTALVIGLSARKTALILLILFGLPTLAGIIHAGKTIIQSKWNPFKHRSNYLIHLSFWCLGGSWLLWFALLGSPWHRYLFPATFLGAIFVSNLVFDLTDGFDFKKSMKIAAQTLRQSPMSKKAIKAVMGIFIIEYGVLIMLFIIFQSLYTFGDKSLLQTAHYFDSSELRNKTIESYDSELFFLLDQKYHYPPDQAHVLFNRQILLGEEINRIYDPLLGSPDYLVVGPFSEMWHIYDEILEGDQFRLVLSTQRYLVYKYYP